MRQTNGCSTHALKCGAAEQWIKEELAQIKEEAITGSLTTESRRVCKNILSTNIFFLTCLLPVTV